MNSRALQPVTLKWNGEEYVVPVNSILPIIAAVESILTLAELQNALISGSIPLAKVSMAYGAALRCAGCAVTDAEVYSATFPGEKDSTEELEQAMDAVLGLVSLMTPPSSMREKIENSNSGNGKPSTHRGGSSKKLSKRG